MKKNGNKFEINKKWLDKPVKELVAALDKEGLVLSVKKKSLS